MKKMARLALSVMVLGILVSACGPVAPSLTPTWMPTSTTTDTSTVTLTLTVTLTPSVTSTPTITEIPSITPTPTVTLTLASNAACIPTDTLRQVAQVVGIVDGDTIHVLIEGVIYSVRYIGMDTPERGDYYFWQATDRNSELVSDQVVTLIRDISETDRYGRLLRYVLVGDTFVNYTLVEEGFATAWWYPPDVACSDALTQAQQWAEEYQEGIWVRIPTLVPQPTARPYVPPTVSSSVYYANCTAARAAGAAPIHRGDPGYRSALDRDNDGIACE